MACSHEYFNLYDGHRIGSGVFFLLFLFPKSLSLEAPFKYAFLFHAFCFFCGIIFTLWVLTIFFGFAGPREGPFARSRRILAAGRFGTYNEWGKMTAAAAVKHETNEIFGFSFVKNPGADGRTHTVQSYLSSNCMQQHLYSPRIHTGTHMHLIQRSNSSLPAPSGTPPLINHAPLISSLMAIWWWMDVCWDSQTKRRKTVGIGST